MGPIHAGDAFLAGCHWTLYSLKSPSRSYNQRLLHLFQPKPWRCRALAKSLRIFFSTHRELDVPDDGLTIVGHGKTPPASANPGSRTSLSPHRMFMGPIRYLDTEIGCMVMREEVPR